MNKLELAHAFALRGIDMGVLSSNYSLDLLVAHSWQYADLMLAEDEKRKDKNLPGVLMGVNQTFINGVEQPRCEPERFVLDWHNVPDRFKYWAMDSDGTCFLAVNKPTLSFSEWKIDCKDCGGDCYQYTGNLGYKGDWKQSLRKRPE